MLVEAIATAVLLAELALLIRYRIVRRRQERPGDWPRLTDVGYGHLAAALAAAAAGWAAAGAPLDLGTVAAVLFLGGVVPAQAALAATALRRPLTGWFVCGAGGFTAGLALL
ncbi:hypothetical protein [Streptomyces sp. G45]|uniref:hypothetical protein n=1 Tax=Streptomyces sp. G45 TaxID=3406627 RepID=UPI003C28BE0F